MGELTYSDVNLLRQLKGQNWHACNSGLGRESSPVLMTMCTYTAVSTKVVQKKRKSVRDNAER